MIRRSVPVILLALLAVPLSGCLVALAAGAAAGAAGYAWLEGEMTHTFNFPASAVHDAVIRTLKDDYSYAIIRDRLQDIEARTPGGTTVTVEIEYLTPTATNASIRVGTFGDKETSHAILTKIGARLGEKPVP